MKKHLHQSLRTAVATAAGVLGLAVALGLAAQGCGAGGASTTEASQGESTMISTMTALPPIDLAAPATFRTASFALG